MGNASRRALAAGHSAACIAAAQPYWQHNMGAPCICSLALRPPSKALAELEPPRAERTAMPKLDEAAKAYREAAKAHREAVARAKAAREEFEAADRALGAAFETKFSARAGVGAGRRRARGVNPTRVQWYKAAPRRPEQP